ncbi:RNA pyrophosphohydrolase [Lachnospiraceae bacterium]|nr:RNA pyrophosphohydrolase [Lachnospiraceae bacterium]
MDILFHTDEYVFSYRVAGICIQDGKVLLQKPTNDTAFAFPGGHVTFGESNEQTLMREFQEEIGADISVGDLKWVGEIFFPWNNKPCHQICLYYIVEINSENIPTQGMFMGQEQIEGQKFKLEFHWVPLDELKNIEVYPTNIVELMNHMEYGVQHFIYRE